MRVFTLFFVLFFPCSSFASSASLVGSKESLRKQNEVADQEALQRIRTLAELKDLKSAKVLLPLPESVVDKRLSEEYRWSLPRVSSFLEDLASVLMSNFGREFKVTSAVRTIEYQKILQIRIPNAVPTEGERASSHLTGATVDITKVGMSKKELQFVRRTLLDLEERNLIEATEEWVQSCFHIMVFASYNGNLKAPISVTAD
jgi:uncharacterized protein YcbK (DUF882 family)